MSRAVCGLLVAIGLLVASCIQPACGCVAPVTVFGAASLAAPLEELTAAFAESYGAPTHIVVSTGSSTALRTQIEQGARADVFLSADTTNPQQLLELGLVDGPIVPFATNHLVIVVPDGNPAQIESALDLGRPGVRIIAAGPDVPITRYAEQAVTQLAAVPGYPTDLAATIESNIVSREDNVAAVTAKIALGEGDAAIVYGSDARTDGVESVELPGQVDVRATYGGVVLKRATGPRAANAFLDWVRSQRGQEILAAYGFGPAR
jgi:molybdate transport system substrate-binding protein